MAAADDIRPRCSWVPDGDPLYAAYHDEEWGVPSHDDRHLFEMLVLEGAQAGLSWSTILRKREGYRTRLRRLRRRRRRPRSARTTSRGCWPTRASSATGSRSTSAIANAHAVLAVREEHGSLDAFLWGLVAGAPAPPRPALADVPAETAESRRMSKDAQAAAASASSDRPSATPSCRPSEWPTTTLRSASATPDEAPGERGYTGLRMQEMSIYGVSFDMVGKQPIVLLQTP